MASYKILTIFMVLFLVQSSLAISVDDLSRLFDSFEEEMRKNPSPAEKIILFTLDNFISLGQHYCANAFNVSRNILKDKSLMANDKPEVLEFKKNLTMFVEKYEANKKPLLLWDFMGIYTHTIEKYTDVPEEKLNPESKFIAEIVKKYNSNLKAVALTVEFLAFMGNFDKIFEEHKADLDMPMLEWYEKYSSITDFDEKTEALNGFFDLLV